MGVCQVNDPSQAGCNGANNEGLPRRPKQIEVFTTKPVLKDETSEKLIGDKEVAKENDFKEYKAEKEKRGEVSGQAKKDQEGKKKKVRVVRGVVIRA